MKRRACLRGLVLSSLAGTASAAEIKVLSSNAAKTVMEEVVPLFERASGHKVTLGFATSQQVAKLVQGGEAADLVVITPEAIDQLANRARSSRARASTSPDPSSASRSVPARPVPTSARRRRCGALCSPHNR